MGSVRRKYFVSQGFGSRRRSESPCFSPFAFPTPLRARATIGLVRVVGMANHVSNFLFIPRTWTDCRAGSAVDLLAMPE